MKRTHSLYIFECGLSKNKQRHDDDDYLRERAFAKEVLRGDGTMLIYPSFIQGIGTMQGDGCVFTRGDGINLNELSNDT